ncbi:hypothetical protein [Serratia sp. FS14]|uniref:hypothetical protein n=1 Tax=Serratia sp. (strain FS14) TaxID=1327989 RepID=UPI0011859E58|nr:hypothetical protein [Serratia sp. FS14]
MGVSWLTAKGGKILSQPMSGRERVKGARCCIGNSFSPPPAANAAAFGRQFIFNVLICIGF